MTAENPSSAPSSFTATTDDRGRYSMIGLKAGSWKVTASAPGFQASSGNVPIKTIGAPMPPVDFTLAPGASVHVAFKVGVMGTGNYRFVLDVPIGADRGYIP